MSARVSGAIRLVLGLPLYVLSVLVTWPIMLGAVVIYLIDVLWQIVTGSDGITADNPVARVYNWYTGVFRYVVFGDKSTSGGRTVRKWVRN